MADKPQQESFLAQLSEVEVTPVQVQPPVVEVTGPIFATKVDGSTSFGDSSNHIKSEQLDEAYHKQPMAMTSPFVAASPAATTVQSHSANGESTTKLQNSPVRTASTTPQTVTGNVKIQLMEISVDEFKANVEYIQQQYPMLPRRLVCDTFSRANFDSRLAIELLAREQEKKDQTIVPPLVLAAANKHQRQLQQQQQEQQQQQQQQSVSSTPQSATQSAAVAATPTTPRASQSQRSRTSASGGGGRRGGSKATKEDPCYRRVTSVDKEAERVLRQKLKSNVRSRVFNHGVKIAQGRETAAKLFHQRDLQQSVTSPADADSSLDADDTTKSAEAAPASASAVDEAAEDAEEEAEQPHQQPYQEPQSAMRILRDSFPTLDEARIAESLEACNQDVDAAIRVLSGRPLLPAAGGGGGDGGGALKFFKSKQLGQPGQHAMKVQLARKGYVRAELSTGAWMERPPPAAAAAARAAGAAVPAVSTLRVYTVQPKRRISEMACPEWPL